MGGSSKSVTVGYKYYVGMHLVLCHGPVDKLFRIQVDDRTAWQGISEGGSISINRPEIFGGEAREGGIQGTVDFETGHATQVQNSYLLSKLGEFVPAFRCVVGIVLRQVYIGLNPYLKHWSFRLQRIYKRQTGITQWYPETAGILSAEVNEPWIVKVRVTWRNYPPELPEPDWIFTNTVGSQLNMTHLSRPETMNHARQVLGQYIEATWVENPPSTGEIQFQVQFPAFSMTTPCEGQVSVLRAGETQWTVLEDNGNSSLTSSGSYANGWFACVGLFPQLWRMNMIQTNFQSDILAMNPAHIIRECLTDPFWGMGYLDSDIDDVSFISAANTLFAEQMGISIIWDNQSTIEDFVKLICRHIDATLYVDRITGKFVLKLIRADYNESTLIVLNPSNIDNISDFVRPAFGELTNSVTVSYWNVLTSDISTLTVQDIALVQQQGATINTSVSYEGFVSASIASRAAQRDLKVLSTPIASCTIITNRVAENLNIGSVFKLTWPDYDLNELIMRVTSIAFGDGKNNRIRITCVQDIFALPDDAYIIPSPPAWEDPSQQPELITKRSVFEVPYLQLVQSQGQSVVDSILQIGNNPDAGYVAAGAVRPSSGQISARIFTNSGSGYEDASALDFCPGATLNENINQMATTFAITDVVESENIVSGSWFQIGNELMSVENISTSSITVKRGVLDTVPVSHISGEVLLFWDAYSDADPTEYVASDVVSVKLLSMSGLGSYPLGIAPEDVVTLRSRAIRPYPPGNFTINGEYFPSSAVGNLDISWATRNRVQQTGGILIGFSDGSITEETGTTYRIDIYNATTNTLKASHSGITGTSDTFLLTELLDVVRLHVRLFAVRDGYDSYMSQVHTFDYFSGDISMQFQGSYTPPVGNDITLQFTE